VPVVVDLLAAAEQATDKMVRAFGSYDDRVLSIPHSSVFRLWLLIPLSVHPRVSCRSL
jgi:hypothetical protein